MQSAWKHASPRYAFSVLFSLSTEYSPVSQLFANLPTRTSPNQTIGTDSGTTEPTAPQQQTAWCVGLKLKDPSSNPYLYYPRLPGLLLIGCLCVTPCPRTNTIHISTSHKDGVSRAGRCCKFASTLSREHGNLSSIAHRLSATFSLALYLRVLKRESLELILQVVHNGTRFKNG